MTAHLPILALLLPLLGGIVILLARAGGLCWQRRLNLVLSSLLVALTLGLFLTSLDGAHRVYQLGNWPAPFGIVLVLDQLSGLMLLLTGVLALAALAYAIFTDVDRQGEHFHVLFQIQLFGLNGAFLTGDLFNLFVFFEVLLLASYGLLLHGGGRLRTRGGLHYVVINLVGSTLFLFAVGTLYGMLGTLNIADMAVRTAQLGADDVGIVAAAGLLLLIVFGIKAALFPLYLWLPGAYAHATAPIAALFAIMTKVGLYAIIRVHGTVFGDEAGPLAGIHADALLVLGMAGLMMAALGVTAARALREQVAYLMLASVSALLIGIGLNRVEAIAATLYYLLHSTLVAAALFLLADIIARARGETGDKLRVGAAMPSAILIGSLFLIASVAMTGMPPLSGFLGKVLILHAALQHDWFGWVLATLLIAGLLQIVALARTGSMLFYQVDVEARSDGETLNRRAFTVMLLVLAASPLLVVFAQPVSALTEGIAGQLADSRAYIDAVLNQPATGE